MPWVVFSELGWGRYEVRAGSLTYCESGGGDMGGPGAFDLPGPGTAGGDARGVSSPGGPEQPRWTTCMEKAYVTVANIVGAAVIGGATLTGGTILENTAVRVFFDGVMGPGVPREVSVMPSQAEKSNDERRSLLKRLTALVVLLVGVYIAGLIWWVGKFLRDDDVFAALMAGVMVLAIPAAWIDARRRYARIERDVMRFGAQ